MAQKRELHRAVYKLYISSKDKLCFSLSFKALDKTQNSSSQINTSYNRGRDQWLSKMMTCQINKNSLTDDRKIPSYNNVNYKAFQWVHILLYYWYLLFFVIYKIIFFFILLPSEIFLWQIFIWFLYQDKGLMNWKFNLKTQLRFFLLPLLWLDWSMNCTTNSLHAFGKCLCM